MKRTIAVALFLFFVPAAPVLAQSSLPQAKQSAPAAVKPVKITITGKIAKSDQGFIIQGEKPPELFTILNPNPKVLDGLAKSGKTVKIEAISAVGDNVNIKMIDGKPYPEPQSGKCK